MAAPISDLASVIFHDVAVYFSSEEWEILTDWQKELYKNVMREIHSALLTLDIYLRIKREETACPWPRQDSGCPVFDPKLSLWIKQENVTFSDEEEELEEKDVDESLCSPHIGSIVGDPDQPQLIKWEKALGPDGQQNLVESLSGPNTAQLSAQPEASQGVKQKERFHPQTKCNSEGKECLSEPFTVSDDSGKGTLVLPLKPPRQTATKRMELKLRDKILVLQEYEKRKVSMRELAAQFGVSKTQIGQIVKRKEELLTEYLNDASGDRVRRRRRTENERLNTMVWDWIQMVRAENVALSGAVVKRKALELAEQLGVTEFKASNGWLDSFKRAHNLHQFTSTSCWSQGELR